MDPNTTPLPPNKTHPTTNVIRLPNDAVLHPALGIKRVLAVTPDNRVVIDSYYASNGIEPSPEIWLKVGVFVKSGILAQIFLGKNEYEFVATIPTNQLILDQIRTSYREYIQNGPRRNP